MAPTSVEHVTKAVNDESAAAMIGHSDEYDLLHVDVSAKSTSILEDAPTILDAPPVMSSSGTYIQWIDADGSSPRIIRLNVVDQTHRTHSLPAGEAEIVDVSPDDRYILYTHRESTDEHWHLHRYDTYREIADTLATDVWCPAADYSPTGEYIAYTGSQADSPQPRIIPTSDNTLESHPLPVETAVEVQGWDSQLGLLLLSEPGTERWAEFSVGTLTYKWHHAAGKTGKPLDMLPGGQVVELDEQGIRIGGNRLTIPGEADVIPDPSVTAVIGNSIVYSTEGGDIHVFDVETTHHRELSVGGLIR